MSSIIAGILQAGISDNPAFNLVLDATSDDGVFAFKTESGIVLKELIAGYIPGQEDMEYNQYNILNQVYQVAGIPTGGIIESGINEYGVYIKFADGTLISYKPGTTNVPENLYFNIAYFVGNYVTLASVITPPTNSTITSKIDNMQPSNVHIIWNIVTNSSFSVPLTSVLPCVILQIGRWY